MTAHSIDAQPLYTDDHDRRHFLALLDTVTRETRWRCLGFCLMETHYHLLLEERDMPLSRSMRLLNGRYASRFNERHGRRGHVFEGRYRDRPVADDAHLLLALRYLALNPIEVGACARPQDWPWSSYGALIGVGRGWSFVSTAWTLSLFAPQQRRAIEIVRQFVEAVPGTSPALG